MLLIITNNRHTRLSLRMFLGIHNDILDKATTCGVIGLGTYLWIIVTFVTFVKRHFNRLEKHTPGGIGQETID